MMEGISLKRQKAADGTEKKTALVDLDVVTVAHGDKSENADKGRA